MDAVDRRAPCPRSCACRLGHDVMGGMMPPSSKLEPARPLPRNLARATLLEVVLRGRPWSVSFGPGIPGQWDWGIDIV